MLLRSLMHEVFQTERSAENHCEREARRLGDTPPAVALRACAQHAARINQEFPAVARAAGLQPGRAGSLVGRTFSVLRLFLLDHLLEEERSYRGTLLGLRHGIDAVRMLHHAAEVAGKVELADFCNRWLVEREPLVARATGAMRWFALHPAAAEERPGLRNRLDHLHDKPV